MTLQNWFRLISEQNVSETLISEQNVSEKLSEQ